MRGGGAMMHKRAKRFNTTSTEARVSPFVHACVAKKARKTRTATYTEYIKLTQAHSANAYAPNADGVGNSGGEGGVTVTGSGGGGDTRGAFFFEKLSVCWPLGSLRFASILAAASTAFFTCGNRPVS